MPQFDLRKDDETFIPHAAYKVLAVMLHPTNLIQRERMFAHVSLNSNVRGVNRRRPLSKDEFFSDAQIYSHNAIVAGGLLVTRLQLKHNDHPFSLNRAIPLVRALLPKWQQPFGNSWPTDSSSRSWPRSRRKMLDAWAQFRPAAHLWAALIHIGQHHDALGEWRWGHELPTFLAYADAFLEMAGSLPAFDDQRFVLTREEAWTFLLPQRLLLEKQLIALRLNEQQLAILQRS